ncbi:MAG TPA: hypothetical protein VMV72_18605 [Verrucomicrobiae bacterium]|nr:hypothetical protein [Verrucomicrobiae bacterium]
MTGCLPYFRIPERIDALRRQLQEWQGTRWQHAGNRPSEMRCGITGDCLFWIHVFKAIGALPPHIEIPPYRKMEAAADKMAMLRRRIEETGRAEMVWCSRGSVSRENDEPGTPHRGVATPRVPLFRSGDVLLFASGMSGAHCGLIVRDPPPHFVHLSQNGLIEEPLLQAHWIDSLVYVYRLLECADSSALSAARQSGDKSPRSITAEGA